MNDGSCCSRGGGSRPDRALALLGCVIALAACGAGSPPTAQSIALGRGEFAPIVRVETLDYVDGHSASSGLQSAARLAYSLGPPRGGLFKVRVLLFRDETAAVAHWRRMHRPEALAATTPLAAGDEGWIYRDEMAATRAGRSIIEIKARGGHGRLADFTYACAAKASRELGR